MQTVSLQGSDLEAHATPLTRMASEAGLTVGSSISAANAVVPTLNPSVPPCPNPSGKGTETGTRGGLVGVQRSTPLTGASEEEIPPLPTPINVEILENFLLDHPIRDFVLRLCSKVHRYGRTLGILALVFPDSRDIYLRLWLSQELLPKT